MNTQNWQQSIINKKYIKEGTEAFQRAIEENPNNEHAIFFSVYKRQIL